MSTMSESNALPNFQGLLDIETPFGAHLSGKYIQSFAYTTIKDRLPVILTKIIDNISRNKEKIAKKYGENSQDTIEEVKQLIGSLSELKSEMMTNKILKPLELSNTKMDVDVEVWNKRIHDQEAIDKSPPTWFNTYWLLAECYMYRRISQILSLTKNLATLDIFEEQKNSSFRDSIDSISLIAKYTMSLFKGNSNSLDEQKKDFKKLLKLSLWGNRCDLTLSAGAENNADKNPIDRLTLLEEDLLIDDSQSVWNLLDKSRNTDVIIDIVLDNAGYELFTDLCFAAFLINHGLSKKIRFYVKRIPWFISDVTERDFHWTIDFMNNSMNVEVKAFGEVCSNYLKCGKWSIEIQSFWTEPFDFSEMKSEASALYSQLSNANLVIFKGDLNYRKLLGDINWEFSTQLATALRELKPTSLVSLRTVKADLIVGLKNETVEQLKAKNKHWMTTGQYGVIHAVIH